ncbi:MAG TPA: DNA phosphorothioation system sulfurtransferase DndC [Candidatus Latescibacteria bacterium]|nr:DNA phosphorothioation system sulfurtransferase DndC [Candidatus Latescibacterota bacterium]
MTKQSGFDELGFKETVDLLIDEVKALYLADEIPWVVGYSGGKDSTTVLQLVWSALADLPEEQRHKTVHAISTDTLVENPIVARWVSRSLEAMADAATAAGVPILPHQLTPEIDNTFWVNLIGRGYPAPRQKFRWCTERLKIKPSNAFIRNVVRANGEAIVVLGTRKAESTSRRHRMEKLEDERIRDRLSPNGSLPNSLVYSPIEDWSNDDVWLYLMQTDNPWGYDNKDLMAMYRGASADNECPLVVDTSTPSCGSSRFGCWTCTLVDKDKSMSAMIQNDEEKEWMLPLLELRNALDVADDRHLREFRRMSGKVQLFHERPIHGPYTEEARHDWVRRLLEAQTWIRVNGPDYVAEIELVSMEELHEIRRIWVFEKREIEDALPGIYLEATGEEFPGPSLENVLVLRADDLAVLRDICGGDDLHYEMTRGLLDVERQYRSMARRAGLFDALEKTVRRCYFDDEEDAVDFARRRSLPFEVVAADADVINIDRTA